MMMIETIVTYLTIMMIIAFLKVVMLIVITL